MNLTVTCYGDAWIGSILFLRIWPARVYMGGLYWDAGTGAGIMTGTAVWGLVNLWGIDKGSWAMYCFQYIAQRAERPVFLSQIPAFT